MPKPEETVRTFIAVEIPEAVKAGLRDVQSQLVSKLETVGQGFLRAIHAHRSAIDGLNIDASVKGGAHEAEDP